jgi:hypothetical protein
MLEERVERCGPFGLGQHSEPWSLVPRRLPIEGLTLLNSTKLFGEVLISRSSSHLFKSLLPVGQVLEPLVNLLGCLSAEAQITQVKRSLLSGVLDLASLAPGKNSELGRPPCTPRLPLPNEGRAPRLSLLFPGITPDEACRG